MVSFRIVEVDSSLSMILVNTRTLGCLLIFLAIGTPGSAETPDTVNRPEFGIRPAHTYSIVARDSKTGELGVAVQSHWFNVGEAVAWAEAGVGAIATQSFIEPGYGPRGLELMRSGLSADAALRALVHADPGQRVRQIAFVDTTGRVAVHTGSACIDEAGHHKGDGYSVQANMMLKDTVVPAMAKAFEQANGPLAERLIAALRAAEGAGGDIRGRQSAALRVVAARPTGRVWKDRKVDLRVDDHAHPVEELARLLALHRAYEHMSAGDVAVEHGDMTAALEHYRAASKLAPNNVEMVYWHAVALASKERFEEAMPLFRRAFSEDANWRELTRRLAKPGILTAQTINKIVNAQSGRP